MCRQRRHYIYRANGTPKLFIIHYSLLIRKVKPCAPVAFIIYKNSFLTKAPLPKGGWRREATGGYNIPPPQAVPLPLGEGGFISQIFKL